MHNRTTHNRVAARSDEPDDPEGAHASNMQACTALMDAHASQSTNKDHFATYIAAQNLLIAQNAQQRTTGSWHGATTPEGAYASRMQARTALHPYSCSHITIHERRSFRNISQIILTERQHHGAVCRVHMASATAPLELVHKLTLRREAVPASWRARRFTHNELQSAASCTKRVARDECPGCFRRLR